MSLARSRRMTDDRCLYRTEVCLAERQLRGPHSRRRCSRCGGSNRRRPTSAEHAVHLDVEPPTVSDNRDESATISPQVLVPTINSAVPANDNNPIEDTLLVDTPAAPEPTVEVGSSQRQHSASRTPRYHRHRRLTKADSSVSTSLLPTPPSLDDSFFPRCVCCSQPRDYLAAGRRKLPGRSVLR